MHLVTVGALAVLALAVVVALTIERHIPGRRPIGLHGGRGAASAGTRSRLRLPMGAPFAGLSIAAALAEIDRRLTELEQLAEASPADQLAERLAQLEQRIADLEGGRPMAGSPTGSGEGSVDRYSEG